MYVYGLLILCVLFWSANFVIGRFVAGAIEPIELAFFRWLGVFIVMFPVLIVQRKTIVIAFKGSFGKLSVLALLGITGFNTLLYIGLSHTTATNALLINSSIPILILLFSVLILRQTITLMQGMGIGLSTLGVIFLVLRGDVQSLQSVSFNEGDLWVIASSVSWALYSVLVKFRPKELSSMLFFTTIVTLGLLFLTPLYMWQGYTFERERALIVAYWPFIGYVVLFTSVFSYYLWHQGIARIGADKTGQFTHLMPLFGSILAFVFLGERLEWYHLGGAVLIAMGIYFSLFVRRQSCSRL